MHCELLLRPFAREKSSALKGLGGFQLIVDARNQAAVVRLRERKHREEKPFALMYPSLDAVRVDGEILPIWRSGCCSRLNRRLFW